jgi:hypothetical protein
MNGKKRAKSYSFHDINEMGHRYLGFYTSEIEGSKALFYSTPPPGVTLQKRVTDLNYILDIASTVVEEDKEFVMEQWVEPVSEALDIINNAIPSKRRTALKPAIIESSDDEIGDVNSFASSILPIQSVSQDNSIGLFVFANFW